MTPQRHNRRRRKPLIFGAMLAVAVGVVIAAWLRPEGNTHIPTPGVPRFAESVSYVPTGSASATAPAPIPEAIPTIPSVPADASDLSRLRARSLDIPVTGFIASQLNDNYTQERAGGLPHEALDIMAPRGTPVLAVEDGRIVKLFLSKPGGITLYQFDPSGEYAYYYAHLDGYADGIAEGGILRKGQVIGYVGSSGNASPHAPHLHFAIFKLGAEKQWWRGTPINPFLVWRDAKP